MDKSTDNTRQDGHVKLFTKFSEKKISHGKVYPKLGIYRGVLGYGLGERFLVKE